MHIWTLAVWFLPGHGLEGCWVGLDWVALDPCAALGIVMVTGAWAPHPRLLKGVSPCSGGDNGDQLSSGGRPVLSICCALPAHPEHL